MDAVVEKLVGSDMAMKELIIFDHSAKNLRAIPMHWYHKRYLSHTVRRFYHVVVG